MCALEIGNEQVTKNDHHKNAQHDKFGQFTAEIASGTNLSFGGLDGLVPNLLIGMTVFL